MVRNIPSTSRLISLICLIWICIACNRQTSNTPTVVRQAYDQEIDSCKSLVKLLSLEAKYIDAHNYYAQMRTKFCIGKLMRESSEFQQALNYHKEALQMAEELKDTFYIMLTLQQLGTTYRRIGRLEEASDVLYKVLDYYEKTGKKEERDMQLGLLLALNGIGNIQLELGNNEEAIAMFKRGLKIDYTINNRMGIGIDLGNIGKAFSAMHQDDSAMYYFQKSLQADIDFGSTLGIAINHNDFGDIYIRSGKIQQALEEYKIAYNLLKDHKDRYHFITTNISIIRALLQQGLTKEAKPYLDRAMQESQRMHSFGLLGDIYLLKSQYDEQTGNIASAFHAYKLGRDYKDSIANDNNINHLQNLRVNYEREQSQHIADNLLQEKKSQQQLYVIILLTLIIIVAIATVLVLVYILRARRLQNQKLSEMHTLLEKAEQMKTLFIQNISHEVRTPLNAISGFTQVMAMEEELSLEERQAYSEYIMKNTELMTKLVNDILDLSNMQTGHIDIRSGRVVLQELINDVSINMEGQLPPGVILIQEMPEEPIDTLTDADRLRQILVNLISNSCKNTTEGSITISLAEKQDNIQIACTDTGCGIPPEKAEIIFESFEKLDRYKQGSGIGLSICRMICDAMNAKIYLDTTYTEGGARFIVELLKQQR